jgi:DNA-binding SARP family transcriptional activator/TolB-like protein
MTFGNDAVAYVAAIGKGDGTWPKEAAMSARFQIHVLGNCKIVNAETGVEYVFKSRKARCLIGLIALWPSGVMTREKLASFLWDPAPEELARSSLRQCLKEIRDVLGPVSDDILQTSRLDIRLMRENVDVDALTFARQIEIAKNDHFEALLAAKSWQGELFGDALPSAPVLEAWVYVERSRLRALISNLLTDVLLQLISATNFADSAIAEELVRIEPSHELAHQYLMRFYVGRGDQAGALRQFATLETALSEELDSEPSQESLDLLVAIKRGDVPSAPASQAPLTPLPDAKYSAQMAFGGLPKITIRPPLTRAHDDSQDYLADGFAGLLKVSLSRFRCWIILSWPSNGFDSKVKIDYPDLGRAIGAGYAIDIVLDWRQSQGQVFVSLVDCSDGSQVWSDAMPVTPLELQSMSSSIAGTISAKLASRINHIGLLRFARKPANAADAYDNWLRGHQLSRSWSSDDDVEAQLLLTKAIELDPGMACAYSSLAGVLMTQGFVRPGYPGTQSDIKRGFEFAKKAVSLDPFDSRNHLSVGWAWLMAGSAARADSHFRLAVELNPFDSETLIACASGLGFIGDCQTAKTLSDQAFSLNPIHSDYFLGYLSAIQYLRGDYAGAISSISASLDVFLETRAWQASAFAMLGQNQNACDAFSAFIAAFEGKWQGEKTPRWADIEAWLKIAIPLVWPEGRAAFNKGLARAREIHLAGGSSPVNS